MEICIMTGKELIKQFEGCKLKAYLCPAGIPTIGYGHTEGLTKADVTNGRTITQQQADTLLDIDYAKYEKQVEDSVKTELNENQLGALTSFAYNLGINALRNSTLMKHINGGDFKQAAGEFERWVRAGGKILPGLVKRRAAERALFEGR